jgi:hypothetical protein
MCSNFLIFLKYSINIDIYISMITYLYKHMYVQLTSILISERRIDLILKS